MKRRLNCLLTDLSWRIIPIASFRAWLLKIHLDRCRYCQQELASQEEVRSAMVLEEISFPGHLLSGLKSQEKSLLSDSKRSSESEPKKINRLLRVYAGITALIIAVLLFSFAWYLGFLAENDSIYSDNDYRNKIVSQLQVEYVRSDGQAADTFIYRAEDPAMIIIWVETRN